MQRCPAIKYKHSTGFKLLSSSWRKKFDYTVSTGILVQDRVVISTEQGYLSLGRIPFASMIFWNIASIATLRRG